MSPSVMNQALPTDRDELFSGEAKKAVHRFADIGVHVTGTDSDAVVVSAAARLGEMFAAHLEGLLTNHIPSPPAIAAPGVDALAADLRRRGVESGNALFAKAKERLDTTGLPSDLRRVDGVGQDFAEATARLARATDLFVIAQPDKDDVMTTPVLEGVLFNAGSAALVVPKEASDLGDLDTVLIAWRDTPECARAIAAALPLLQRAGQVVLVSIAENGSDEEPPGARRRRGPPSRPSRDQCGGAARATLETSGRGAPQPGEDRRSGADRPRCLWPFASSRNDPGRGDTRTSGDQPPAALHGSLSERPAGQPQP